MKKEKSIIQIVLTIVALDIVIHFLLYFRTKALFYALVDYHRYLGIYALYVLAGAGISYIVVDVLTDIGMKISNLNLKIKFWR